ncbi:hypothetical protein BS17DRAFT_702729 [Gyrodon lividus]|nr:hypothetical protein BS17DRAFT_702729 [Gyrodon lividus]
MLLLIDCVRFSLSTTTGVTTLPCFTGPLMSSESQLGNTSGFFSFILTPGSSLHPMFLLGVDCAFAALFLVFVWSAYLTKGNAHFFILMAIEIALWASVKWFVQELKRLPATSENVAEKKDQ